MSNTVEIDLDKVARIVVDALANTVLDTTKTTLPDKELIEQSILRSLINSPLEAFETAISVAMGEVIIKKVYNDNKL